MKTLHLQSGVTLISLMVGLTISMIVTVAMLVVFKNAIFPTMDARTSASTNAQRTAALLRAGISLQDAGYGIDAPQSPRDLLVLNATLDAATKRLSGSVAANENAGNAVVWSHRPAAASVQRCAGLMYDHVTGRLHYLLEQECAAGAAGSWQTLAWAPQIWVDTSRVNPKNAADTTPFPALPGMAWTLKSAGCQPFGITAASAQVRLTLTQHIHNANGAVLTDTLCLINFQS